MITQIVDIIDKISYVKVIDVWGSDERIIESARMSTNKGFEGWANDIKLLAYLYKNKHMTPFEMCGMTLEIKAPIFVFREWHRHRTQSYNEMSGRYIALPDENYVPDRQRIIDGALKAGANRQAQGAKPLDEQAIDTWLTNLQRAYELAQSVYQAGLASGIPKELARLPVPVARYSRMRASGNLRNWLAFLTLRMDSAAQWEIRAFAGSVGRIVEDRFPRTWSLFRAEQN